MIARLVAALSPSGQQMLSEVGEAGHGGMPRCDSLEEVTLEDVIAVIRPSPFKQGVGRDGKGQRSGSGQHTPLFLPSTPLSPPPPPWLSLASSISLPVPAFFLPLPS